VATRTTIAAAVLAGAWIAWSQNQPLPAALTIQKVTDNLYVITGGGVNVAVMPTTEGVILVDDGYPRDVRQIQEKVKSVTDKPIRYVLNTHAHPDHIGGNAALLAANAQILIHKNARASMAEGKMPGLEAIGGTIRAFRPQITYTDQLEVFLGGKEVIAHHFGRGHTNGDSVIYFPSEKVLHAGDLFAMAAPFCDTSAGGSIREWDKTLEKVLQQYDFDTVIPGHGPVMKKADMAKFVQTLPAIRDRVKAACAGGGNDAANRVDLKDLGLNPSDRARAMFERGIPGMCRELAQ
jgi:glyoxylase-like metal-dependent hydrolase (beta-lactamase superfamily II)